jgi:hypothetical protein
MTMELGAASGCLLKIGLIIDGARKKAMETNTKLSRLTDYPTTTEDLKSSIFISCDFGTEYQVVMLEEDGASA